MTGALRVLTCIETLGMGGGAESLLASLLPALRRESVFCDVLALRNFEPDFGVELEAQGFRVIRLNVARRAEWAGGLLKSRAQLALGHYDVLWSHMFEANLFAGMLRATRANAPLVVTFHGNRESTAPPHGAERVEQWVAQHLAHTCVGASTTTAAEFTAAYQLSNSTSIYNGVDVEGLIRLANASTAGEVRARLARMAGLERLPKDAFVVLVPSRFVAKKGHAVLLEALALLQRQKKRMPWVFCVGYGALRQSLTETAQKTGLKQVFFGEPLPFQSLIATMAHCDLVAIPSLREPFGLAAAEAMAVGTPALVSRVDGLAEIVGDSDCALLVEPHSAEDLAAKLAEAMRDADGRERRRAIASARVRTLFDISVCARNWSRVLRAAAGQS